MFVGGEKATSLGENRYRRSRSKGKTGYGSSFFLEILTLDDYSTIWLKLSKSFFLRLHRRTMLVVTLDEFKIPNVINL
jgi:hypothetical protein